MPPKIIPDTLPWFLVYISEINEFYQQGNSVVVRKNKEKPAEKSKEENLKKE